MVPVQIMLSVKVCLFPFVTLAKLQGNSLLLITYLPTICLHTETKSAYQFLENESLQECQNQNLCHSVKVQKPIFIVVNLCQFAIWSVTASILCIHTSNLDSSNHKELCVHPNVMRARDIPIFVVVVHSEEQEDGFCLERLLWASKKEKNRKKDVQGRRKTVVQWL